MSTLFVTTFFCAGKMRPLRVAQYVGRWVGVWNHEDIQSNIRRFGVSGMFLGSKYRTSGGVWMSREIWVYCKLKQLCNLTCLRISHPEWGSISDIPCHIHSFSWSRDLWRSIKRCSSTSKIVDFPNHACQEIFALLTLGERFFCSEIGCKRQMSNEKKIIV